MAEAKKPKYRVVVDHFNDRPSRDLIEPLVECYTLKEARKELNRAYSLRLPSCGNEFYLQRRCGDSWEYVDADKAPKLVYKVSTLKNRDTGEVIDLPFIVSLNRSDMSGNVSSLFKVIRTMVENWPKEAK
jgi:hypothetical protein